MKTVLNLLIFCFVFQAKSADFSNSFEAALRSNNAIVTQESFQAGVKPKQDFGVQLFYISQMKFSEYFKFRTGAGLVMRDSKVDFDDYDALAGNQSVTIMASRLFLDVPVTLSFNSSNFELFAGLNLANKLSSSIDVSPSIVGTTNNNLVDEKSFVTVPIVGFDYSYSSTSKIGLFYEFEQNYSKNWNQTAIGLSAGWNL